jgi:hypothetical protein
VTKSARRAGDALVRASGELVRIWRSARAQDRPAVFPGLLDGLLPDFFLRAADGLGAGRDPALVWTECEGIVRLDPRDLDRSREELDAEWDLAEQVLVSACEALEAGDAASEWLARAIVIARTGSRTLDARSGPEGVAVVWWLSGFRGVRRPARARAGARP